MTLGEKLKDLRVKKDMTIREIAKHFNIGKTTYANYEYDQRKPDYEMLRKIAEFYGVSVDYLVGTNIDDSKNTYSGEELTELIPFEFKTLFENQNIDYVRFAKDMMKEEIDIDTLKELIEISKKIRQEYGNEKDKNKDK